MKLDILPDRYSKYHEIPERALLLVSMSTSFRDAADLARILNVTVLRSNVTRPTIVG